MSKFTVRVELRCATEEDYEKLRMEMEDRGFSRLLPAGDGGKYLLPTEEYNLDAGWTPEQVLNTVKTAAAATHRPFAVLVTESLSRKRVATVSAFLTVGPWRHQAGVVI
jgi:hypothetical protein